MTKQKQTDTTMDGYTKAGYIVKTKKEKEYIYKCGYINSNWEKIVKPEYTAITRILDIDSKDIYLITAKERSIWTIQKR